MSILILISRNVLYYHFVRLPAQFQTTILPIFAFTEHQYHSVAQLQRQLFIQDALRRISMPRRFVESIRPIEGASQLFCTHSRNGN